jgi:tetratricopeptide (TPR) repeat protein
MRKIIACVMVAYGVLLAGCGPDTIFVRPRLDSPDQHLAAGHQLLQRGKYDDACREFIRAKELMAPNHVAVFVGLGLALGYKGEIAEGRNALDQARQLAISDKDRAEVQKGYDRFAELMRNQGQVPPPQ